LARRGVLAVNRPETYHAASLTGLGITQAPRVSIRVALRRRQLAEALAQYRAAAGNTYLAAAIACRAERLFMEWLTSAMKTYVD
jgi:DNA-binding transcriptional LysR family regulator